LLETLSQPQLMLPLEPAAAKAQDLCAVQTIGPNLPGLCSSICAFSLVPEEKDQ
jgi:hypothetical protein